MEGYNKVKSIFSEKAISVLKDSLIKSNGNEVLWGCKLDETKKVIDEIETIFYGSNQSVLFDRSNAIKYDLILHNHPSNIIEPSDEDQHIANICINNAIGFAIIDNNLEECYIVIPPKSLKKRKKVREDEVEKILKNPSQLIFDVLPNYKIRESQIDLAKSIQNIINDDKIGFIEAPTGIGKSLGYLLPSILYIDKNKVKVIISTYTKNLQNQLIKKDIPAALKILDKNLTVEVAYGRQNYLCLLAYSNFIKNHTDLYELASPESIDQIEKWVSKTNNGLILEINGNYDRKIIDEIRSNSTLCLSNKCKFFNECFYYSARRRLNNADIIVTNHHLFLSYELIEEFSDFFPVYNTLIFDEGHNLPDVIESISTFTFSTFEIQKKLYKLVQSQQKNKGLFYLLENSLSKNNLNNKTIVKKILSLLPDLINQVLELERSISNIHNQTIYQIINLAVSNNLSNNKSKILINLTDLAKINPEVLKEIYELLDEIFNQIQFLVDNSAFLIQALQIILEDKVKKDEELSSLQYLYGNIKSIIKFFDDIKDFHEELSDLFNNRSKSQNLLKVLWFEISNNGIYFSFYNEERGLNFNNIIESKVNSTIFISATLATENSFDYIKSQLGLSENIKKNTEDKIYPSIFPYEKNSSLFIIKGINPLIKKDYAKNISDIILKVLSSTKAKTMILTTAYNDINEISEAIKDNHKDIKLLIQESLLLNNSLVDEFKKTDRAVLVVNMSFWEGIDLPGKDLEILIISKLPFKVPDTPILKAKTERMDNQGINSFYSLSLPYAIIKLKQGFGRLIRSEEEKGICILLDDRIISKNYGPIILNSLPKSKLEIVEKDQFLIKFKEKCEELEISK